MKSWCSGLLQTGFHILWALPGQNFDLLKDVILPRLSKEDQSRLRVERFLPQQQVLEHSSVSVFVTHASANGVMEALIAGKPMVAAPLFGDQCYFAARVQELGVGVRIDKTQMTPAIIRSSVQRVIEYPFLCGCSSGGSSGASPARWIGRGHEAHRSSGRDERSRR